ncbi:MAG TPA: hypothetical protein DCL35_01355 [Candidatus Omnitrophica bacterium]|nr:hypothetical protein [Candidatus Omnitrophota bacterium]
MDSDISQQMQLDSSEVRDMMAQAMNEAIRALPKPKLPSWVEAAADFAKFHPWVSLFLLLGVIVLISAVIREVLCSYFKTNDILARLKKVEDELRKQRPV